MTSSTAGHTAGPWLIGKGADGYPIVHTPPDSFSPTGMGIAHVCKRPMCQQHEANARLIAAAPEMKEVHCDSLPILQAVLEEREEINGEEDEVLRDLISRIRSAIAKAGGGA